MSKLWLAEGHHHSLHIERRPLANSGQFTAGGRKLIWHTTEGLGVDSMYNVLRDKNAAPHFIIGKESGLEHLKCIQCIPFNMAARTLEHPAGTPETNRAGCIQVEIVQFARNAHEWDEDFYLGLAHLALTIERHFYVPRKRPRKFTETPNRYTGVGFVRASGHIGHQHAANQPHNHWDPGNFRALHLFKLMRQIEGKGKKK